MFKNKTILQLYYKCIKKQIQKKSIVEKTDNKSFNSKNIDNRRKTLTIV